MPIVPSEPSPILTVAHELSAVEAELSRRRHLQDPVSWVESQLGGFLWSRQREILESVRDNRRTAVHTAHSLGKTWLAARLVAWWIAVHPPGTARVVTSAPTGDLVKAALWHEIGRASVEGSLPGRINQTEWWLPVGAREQLVAFGRKPAEHNYSALQGIHERYVLVVFDESCGIPRRLWDAADSLVSGASCRFLAIGNPDDPLTEFADVCKPGSGWNVIGISAYDSPNFTGERVPEALSHRLVSRVWVEEKKRKWGEDSPLFRSKVLGAFPETTTGGLIQPGWIRAAQDRYAEKRSAGTLRDGSPVELGVDVGAGGDRSVIAVRRGPVVEILRRDQNPDTMETCGNVVHALRSTGASVAKVDEIGIGRGVVDRGREQGHAIVGINVGQAADNPEGFVNLRAEGFWGLRERFEEGMIDLDHDEEDLAAQLVDLRYKRTSSGRVQIESKEEMKRRGRESPDDADAVMLAFLHSGSTGGATWGRRDRGLR